MLELLRSAAVILALILSGNTDPVPVPVPVPDASGDPVPVVPAVPVTAEII